MKLNVLINTGKTTYRFDAQFWVLWNVNTNYAKDHRRGSYGAGEHLWAQRRTLSSYWYTVRRGYCIDVLRCAAPLRCATVQHRDYEFPCCTAVHCGNAAHCRTVMHHDARRCCTLTVICLWLCTETRNVSLFARVFFTLVTHKHFAVSARKQQFFLPTVSHCASFIWIETSIRFFFYRFIMTILIEPIEVIAANEVGETVMHYKLSILITPSVTTPFGKHIPLRHIIIWNKINLTV